eukprot:TRINITY_DN8149_c0_g1_i1.p1 TRINITY_DN8149_c0_g1~~TRINITY_DN8149_c0_g1_i1.p1  ORF type:complete len:314 (-),score=34.15 TRINITY_DN8149_c0_g1_i1:94-1035(-)
MKRTQSTNIPNILIEVSSILSEKLTLGEIIKYSKSTRDLLSLLTLIEKIEQAFYGRSLEEIVNSIGGALETFKDNNNEEIISASLDLRLTTLAEKISSVDVEQKELCPIVAKDIVETINKTGFLVEDVIKVFLDFMKLSENACCDIGRSILSATRILELATPLFTKKKPSVFELYDLIQEYRKGSVVHYDTNDPKYDVYLVAWDKWLSRHPQIIKYIDPSYVAIEPLGHLVPLIPPIIAALPNLGGLPTAPVADFAGVWAGLYQCSTPANAKTVATTIRTHLAVAAVGVGGGIGAGHRICTFTTSTGGNIHLY